MKIIENQSERAVNNTHTIPSGFLLEVLRRILYGASFLPHIA
jgi:hypothetical protein